ncbi:uncharacterized protein LOC105784698 isoform X1 [Gossypium raimondii]|uniref:Uncharacterized protein n=1 Tax=Gossypium raimondii TaxID=29730 RepID=A0A0D2U8B8_GOSRA|nr:uncharacterized protein LOC105784698 isoform X1 [Gossypium raimondii]XP_052490045.1 uncharacterized protein LOC105784698 isoform X1 [Gossypium raimondii]XP_052490046.1 uncharacterized protein LOC105784698 isoform X1 [Gossypium raimondii]XP_052490047.1 uncharacterized protein LOC105784698 isoform X1 [Gossypium raimondii]XP_052490048.1 uncharacterized protein LOC105784698 isoform X1 [Gossypium raimondii]KJB84048.1 hypothetical protein B456_N005500 [Gossypium raimondii]KJB84049.1 hypothetical
MVLFPTINEACRVLDEGVVARASDLDVASVLGMSFPSYCGGIMFWADTVGSKHIYLSLKKWSERYDSYFKPSRYLEERAMKGMPLVNETAVIHCGFYSENGGFKISDEDKSYMQSCKVAKLRFLLVRLVVEMIFINLKECQRHHLKRFAMFKIFCFYRMEESIMVNLLPWY